MVGPMAVSAFQTGGNSQETRRIRGVGRIVGLQWLANNCPTQGQNAKMYFTSEKDFVNMEFPSDKSFILNSAGEVIGYERKVNGQAFSPARRVTQVDTIHANAGQLSAYGWHLLETKRFEAAISYLQRGIALEPNDIAALGYLGHCYLFQNQYEKAIETYRTMLASVGNDEATAKAMISEGFAFFERRGFDNLVIEKAALELGL